LKLSLSLAVKLSFSLAYHACQCHGITSFEWSSMICNKLIPNF
jgi:hypothetical protein